MKLIIFYIALTGPLVVLALISKNIPMPWFILGLFGYVVYNLVLCNRKLKSKGHTVGWFAHLNPFSKKSQQLYYKVYFEA